MSAFYAVQIATCGWQGCTKPATHEVRVPRGELYDRTCGPHTVPRVNQLNRSHGHPEA